MSVSMRKIVCDVCKNDCGNGPVEPSCLSETLNIAFDYIGHDICEKCEAAFVEMARKWLAKKGIK